MVAADSDCPDSLPVKQQFDIVIPHQLRRHAGALLGLIVLGALRLMICLG